MPQTGNLYGQVLFWQLALRSHLTVTLPLPNLLKYSQLPSSYSWTKMTQYNMDQGRNNGKLSFQVTSSNLSRVGRDCNLFYCDHFQEQCKPRFDLIWFSLGRFMHCVYEKMLQACSKRCCKHVNSITHVCCFSQKPRTTETYKPGFLMFHLQTCSVQDSSMF